MDKNDFASRFRAGFNKTDKDQEAMKMQKESGKYGKYGKKKDKEKSAFSKIYSKITGK